MRSPFETLRTDQGPRPLEPIGDGGRRIKRPAGGRKGASGGNWFPPEIALGRKAEISTPAGVLAIIRGLPKGAGAPFGRFAEGSQGGPQSEVVPLGGVSLVLSRRRTRESTTPPRGSRRARDYLGASKGGRSPLWSVLEGVYRGGTSIERGSPSGAFFAPFCAVKKGHAGGRPRRRKSRWDGHLISLAALDSFPSRGSLSLSLAWAVPVERLCLPLPAGRPRAAGFARSKRGSPKGERKASP